MNESMSKYIAEHFIRKKFAVNIQIVVLTFKDFNINVVGCLLSNLFCKKQLLKEKTIK